MNLAQLKAKAIIEYYTTKLFMRRLWDANFQETVTSDISAIEKLADLEPGELENLLRAFAEQLRQKYLKVR